MTNHSSLALLGGVPISSEPLAGEPFPPLTEKTAERLKEVYFSRQWSFNSESEQKFQKTFAEYHGARHGIFMVNGTVTLQCALAACGVKAGDEVIVPALTWMATAMAAHYLGATPVFVDIEPTTLCIDPQEVEKAITTKTKAVIGVHLYGSMANIDALTDICDRHSLTFIEDCAHMQGGKWKGKGAGSWGKVGSFSLQQSKTVSSGEGGICLTDDAEIADKIYRMKHIGYADGSAQGQAASGPPEGLMCHNFRGTAFQAVIAEEQTFALAERIAKYEVSAKTIAEKLDGIDGVRIQSRGKNATEQGYYSFCFIFDEAPMNDISKEKIAAALRAEGLQVGGTYGPVYQHMLYNMPKNTFRIQNGSCPVAEKIAGERTLVLPHQMLGTPKETIEKIAEIIKKVVANHDALRSYTLPDA